MTDLEPGQDVELTHAHHVATTANRGTAAVVRTVMAEEAIVEMTVTAHKAVSFEHLRIVDDGHEAKNTETRLISINDPGVNIEGTHLVGYLETTYDALVSRFGEPGEFGDSYKIDAEWVLRFPTGDVATIYNYKDGKNYLGDEGLDVEQIEDWHIGGRTEAVVGLVHEALSQGRPGPAAAPPHDGAYPPLPEPVLPKEGTAVILGGDRRWAAVSDDGLIGGTLEPGARVTYQGETDDGRHEFSVPVVLRGYVPTSAIRLIEDDQ